jgi:hypothetical protein
MNRVNDNMLSEITVRLRQNNLNNITIGTGILFYENFLDDKVYVLTAAHCLFEDGEKFQQKFNSICIDIYSPQERVYKSITVESINENLLSKTEFEDVAIIILDKEEVDSINRSIPKIQVIKERKSFESFNTKGFPKATKGEELAAVYATWLQEMTETKRFQLQLNADYIATNVEGFSGAGIFLEANNEIYLYGIFTRFRDEEKGNVIYCQYIDSINNLLKKSFLPLIDYSYLGENGLTPLFFANQVEREIKNLGPRFNEKLNFELPIAQIFNSISNNSVYRQNIVVKIDRWLTEKGYRKLKDNEFLVEIEVELKALQQEMKDWLIEFQSHFLETEIAILPLIEKVKAFNKKISDKWHEIFNLSIKQKDEKEKSKKSFDSELNRLREIEDANRELIENIDDLNINLTNHPTLIIEGGAGCGKSHLLGDIATQRNCQNLPTILLLGTTFFDTTLEQNVLKKIDVSCSFNDFLENLNSIGLQINSRVLILIDAINEGAGMDLWKNQIAGFIDEVAKYPAIGLTLTIRSTYFDDIIPVDFNSNPNITIIKHEGFKGNEYEALRLFCKYYNLKLPNFPILNPEFSNPLFLHIICEAVKDLPDKSFPKGFNGINKTYELYKKSLNKKFEEKRPEYKYQNIVSKAIEKLSEAIFETEYQSLEISDAVKLFNAEFTRFPLLFSDLIEESVLIKMRNEYDRENPKDIVFFSYQRLGDFFMAEELLKSYKTKKEIKNAFANDTKFQKIANEYQWSYRGVVEAFSILLPERYDLELFELISLFFHENVDKRNKKFQIGHTYESFTRILLDSLKWRELSSINDKKITNWIQENGRLRTEDWWYTLTELAAIPNHPFNGDRLHRILLRYPMPKRDGLWQNYIRWYSDYDDNKIAFPLKRLIDWAWSPNISSNIDFETSRLVAQTLAWVLSSTDIALRDKTTKALVNLLEQQPEALINVLTAFKDIDDLYILDRLYAVAYGCILRTEKEDSIKTIAQYIYETIFKNGNPPIHILIRDYARNAVEYAIYKNVGLDVDVELIRPPYNNKMPILPESEDDVKEYKLDYDSPNFKINHGMEHNAIYNSLISGIADFGHYIVESAVDDFLSFSFKEDIEYENYLKTLKRNQKGFVKLLYECTKQEVAFNKKNDYQKRIGLKWTESQQIYIDMLDSTRKMCMNEIGNVLNQEQINYVKEILFPYFDRKLKKDFFNPYPVRYWIVKRVFELGYDKKLHGEYDSMVSNYSYRHENKIERIGKKYQWISFYEILAMLADNYKIKDRWNSDNKYDFYKGAWQLSIRNIDPAYITRNKDDDNEESIRKNVKKWWEDSEYTHWNYPDSEWVKTTDDLIDPKKVIEKKDGNGDEWIHLEHVVEWKEPKKIGSERYEGRWKNLCYIIQGCLVKKTDKTKIIDYLRNKNLWGRWLPENGDGYSYLINREKFWSPAYLDTYKNGRKIWDTIRSTKYKIIIATESANGGVERDKSGANCSYNIPCKYIFEGMGLQYASIDGKLKNSKGEIVVMNSKPQSVLVKKKDLIQFLEENNLDIIWTLLGEKFSFMNDRNEESYFKVPCGIYYLEKGKLEGELKMYDRD